MATLLTQENREYKPEIWETVPCPFCEETQHRPHEKFGPNHRYEYVECLGCGLIYASRRPRYDATFVETAYEVYKSGELSAEDRTTIEQNKTSLRQIEKLLGRKGRILDVGCATGLFLVAAQEEGWEATGIDVSKSMTRHCSERLGFLTFCGHYQHLDLSSVGPFDAIHCSHVIEHIPVPNEWMAKFKQDLKPDGVLCLNVPNQYSLDRILKRALKKSGLKKDNWEAWRTPDHLYEPHLKPMRYLIEKHGFTIEECFTYSRHERATPSPTDRLMHHTLKAGSKLRFLASIRGKTLI